MNKENLGLKMPARSNTFTHETTANKANNTKKKQQNNISKSSSGSSISGTSSRSSSRNESRSGNRGNLNNSFSNEEDDFESRKKESRSEKERSNIIQKERVAKQHEKEKIQRAKTMEQKNRKNTLIRKGTGNQVAEPITELFTRYNEAIGRGDNTTASSMVNELFTETGASRYFPNNLSNNLDNLKTVRDNAKLLERFLTSAVKNYDKETRGKMESEIPKAKRETFESLKNYLNSPFFDELKKVDLGSPKTYKIMTDICKGGRSVHTHIRKGLGGFTPIAIKMNDFPVVPPKPEPKPIVVPPKPIVNPPKPDKVFKKVAGAKTGNPKSKLDEYRPMSQGSKKPLPTKPKPKTPPKPEPENKRPKTIDIKAKEKLETKVDEIIKITNVLPEGGGGGRNLFSRKQTIECANYVKNNIGKMQVEKPNPSDVLKMSCVVFDLKATTGGWMMDEETKVAIEAKNANKKVMLDTLAEIKGKSYDEIKNMSNLSDEKKAALNYAYEEYTGKKIFDGIEAWKPRDVVQEKEKALTTQEMVIKQVENLRGRKEIIKSAEEAMEIMNKDEKIKKEIEERLKINPVEGIKNTEKFENKTGHNLIEDPELDGKINKICKPKEIDEIIVKEELTEEILPKIPPEWNGIEYKNEIEVVKELATATKEKGEIEQKKVEEVSKEKNDDGKVKEVKAVNDIASELSNSDVKKEKEVEIVKEKPILENKEEPTKTVVAPKNNLTEEQNKVKESLTRNGISLDVKNLKDNIELSPVSQNKSRTRSSVPVVGKQ